MDRTRQQASTDECFFLMHHDAITQAQPAVFVLGLGAMFSRTMTYTDDLRHDETEYDLNATLDDCREHFQTHQISSAEEVPQFHNTLVWARALMNVIHTDNIMRSRGHTWRIAHLHAEPVEFNPHHPVMRPLVEKVAAIPQYVAHPHNCRVMCREAGIRPWDHDEYGWEGHHTVEGQMHFRRELSRIYRTRGLD